MRSLLLAALLAATPAGAQQVADSARQFPATTQRVIDGDTYVFDVSLGLNIHYTATVRLRGANTPETFHPKTPDERTRGLAAKAVAAALVTDHACVLSQMTTDPVTYNRYVASVRCAVGPRWVNVADSLIAAGLAVPMAGKK